MSRAEVYLERETANDESAVIVKIYEGSGSAVQVGQHIFDIENSKATQELVSPIDGVLLHTLKVGDEVGFGTPIAIIVPPDEADSAILPVAKVSSTSPPDSRSTERGEPRASSAIFASTTSTGEREQYPTRPADRPQKFSRAARELIAKSGIDPASLPMEWVTTNDLRIQSGPTSIPKGAAFNAGPGGQAEGKRISTRKRAEVQSLSSGAGASMLSVLGTVLGNVAITRQAGDIFENRITDVVIYEASRLMARFPNLNSYFADGAVHKQENVTAGLAIDDGGRLVVYGIERAEQRSLSDLRDEILNAISRYVENTLSAAEMSRATFTVTDLSAAPLEFIFPLLPEGQSCIIGITRGAAGEFRLYAGFDHRVTEGREVALFLDELRSRIISFHQGRVATDAQCFFCEKSLTEAISVYNSKCLVKVLNAKGSEVYCCTTCLAGWQ